MRIHRLDPVVANQIAAGEVVERPASAVKELVENSIDARAHQITVAVNGDTGVLWIRDDGEGMAKEDLELAVERHSTSKLTSLDDLQTSTSLGFRGEALAAISSVSRLSIASRPPSEAVGYQLEVTYGQMGKLSPRAMGYGTEVRVQDIFGHQPARLKALKTPAAEFGAIQQTVQQLAIARHDIGFTLRHNDRTVIQTPGQNNPQETLLSLYGSDISERLVPISYEGEGNLTVQGFLAPAAIHRANRLGQGLYLNGRWVTNWMLRAAIEEAYRPNVPDRRYPYFWIWIAVPPDAIDPNAHPTKSEVRIFHETRLRAILFRIVKEALVDQSPAPSYGTPLEAAAQRWDFRETKEPDAQTPSNHILHQEYRDLTPLGQWHAKYIVAQGPEGLYLIDQHAAHERIYFEKFRGMGHSVTISQPLLLAVPETLSALEWNAYTEHQDDLARMGFEIESLGGTTIVVRSVPTAFHDLDSHQGLLRTLLEMFSGDTSTEGMLHPVSWAEQAEYAMAACKAAIKANRPMSMVEMVDLLDQMSRVEDPRGCPHGRPTTIHFSIEEVDRRFGRRG